jgi:signal transduction histidine kinase
MMKTPPGHLLVVDDDRMARLLLARSLTQAGHTVETAESGREALELLRGGSFDAALLDLLMPEMDGYQVLEQIVADDTLRRIPVIMVSGVGEMAGVVTCIELGADDFIHKPFDAALVRARIDNSLLKKRLLEREVSLRQQLEERYAQLVESERMRESLTHLIVHDLRTPLTSVVTSLYTLADSEIDFGADREWLDGALSGGETLAGMINDLLDISKMEAGEMKLECADFPPAALLERVVCQLRPLARENELELVVEAEPDLPLLRADPEKVRRVMVNLVGNALKFTPREGSVTVRARPRDVDGAPGVLFSVTDTGEGIPKEAFGRIFEKFGQVETRKAGRKASTGLGLTFCKMAVEAHRGRIWVESDLGRGSTFFVAVPLCPADLPAMATCAPSAN